MPDPVKLFVGILWSEREALRRAIEALVGTWGAIDYTGADHVFDTTDYYETEMGAGLQRRLVSFKQIVSPDALITAKHICNEMEDKLAGARGRLVNLDVGYLDHHKIVLASFKSAGQKIFLKDGVWADMVARYRGGRYLAFEWTFPDFRDGRYEKELLQIRRLYLDQRKGRGAATPPPVLGPAGCNGLT
jgi:hypothetical protein